MTPQTYIFIGRSGSGKGTQSRLLIEEIKQRSGSQIFHLEPGALFREFVTGDNYSSRLAKEIMIKGERQPDFLAVWMWANLLVKNLNQEDHLLLDGTPRSLAEATTLDTAIKFYDRERPKVIYLNVSSEISAKRLTERHRADDRDVTSIANKLSWFDQSVVPAIDYYRSNADYDFFEINGDQAIDEVKTDIFAKLNLLND